jgi:peptidylprolyl isomerase
MEKASRIMLTLMVVCGGMLLAEEKTQEKPKAERPSKEEAFSPANVAKVSETYGHFVAKSLDNPIIHLNFDSVVKGMQEAKAGKAAPLTEQEYEEALSLMQEYGFKDMAEKNLKDANEFMAKNAKEKGIVEPEKGKLQYQIQQPGQGEVVTEQVIPVVHYSGKYLDGTSFGSSRDSGEPVAINLKTTIPGFREAVLGMKIGEKRKIFIHPDLGYGTSGQLLPNALLIFEVEVVKLNPITKETLSQATDDPTGDENYDDDEDSDDDDDDSDDDDVSEVTQTPAKK